jgi:chemotaxis signal transduction protein
MSAPVSAWLLTPHGLPPVAIAEFEMIEYLGGARPQPVLAAPAHCAAVLFWREHIIPLLDLGALAGQPAREAVQKAAVLAYQDTPGEPLHYIALAIQRAPAKIQVADESACALPGKHAEVWSLLARACFARDGEPTPIVSIRALGSTDFRGYVEAHVPQAEDDPWLTAPLPIDHPADRPKQAENPVAAVNADPPHPQSKTLNGASVTALDSFDDLDALDDPAWDIDAEIDDLNDDDEDTDVDDDLDGFDELADEDLDADDLDEFTDDDLDDEESLAAATLEDDDDLDEDLDADDLNEFADDDLDDEESLAAATLEDDDDLDEDLARIFHKLTAETQRAQRK